MFGDKYLCLKSHNQRKSCFFYPFHVLIVASKKISGVAAAYAIEFDGIVITEGKKTDSKVNRGNPY